MKDVEDPSKLSKADFFRKFFPTKWGKKHLLPATNKNLKASGHEESYWEELEGWIALWVVMSLNPSYYVNDFFTVEKPRDEFWNPPYLGNHMSGNRFRQIEAALCLCNDEPPTEYRDRFFWVRAMILAFNTETKEVFVPSWLCVVDESMVAFLNKYAPGWTAVKRKPHPHGNEYNTTADCFCKIIFHMEIREGKDQPTEGPYSKSKFEEEFGSKVAALVVRMTEGLHGSGRCIILDSGFGYVPAVVQLRNKGLYSTAYIKKHAFWPKYTLAQEAVDAMHDKAVGEVNVRKGTYETGEGRFEVYMVAQADSKHTSLMLSNWGTTERMGKRKVRRVGGELVEFLFTQFSHYYYLGRHGVDDNNRERQGLLSFEDVYRPRDWNRRQFGWMVGAVLANAHMAHEYFVNGPEGRPREHKAEFLREMARDLILNEDWRQKKFEISRRSVRLAAGEKTPEPEDRSTVCEMKKIPAGHKKWDAVGACFPVAAGDERYFKYYCAGTKEDGKACGKRVRTFCACSPATMLCDEHYAAHRAVSYGT